MDGNAGQLEGGIHCPGSWEKDGGIKTTLGEPPITGGHFGVSMIIDEIMTCSGHQHRGMDLKSCAYSRTDSNSIIIVLDTF
jgi:hypothetical protein